MMTFEPIKTDENFSELLEAEKISFIKHQHIDYLDYKTQRLQFLETQTGVNISLLKDYITIQKPNIGVFAGSFNPFHKGHFNVLNKAEQLFDKVIIAFGKNPEKNGRSWGVPNTIKNRQITEYSGLLTDYIDSLGYEVTVIRGLRNSTDFQYEQNQYRYLQELKPNIKIVNIFCDKEFEHISSSGIRTLEKFNKHANYILD